MRTRTKALGKHIQMHGLSPRSYTNGCAGIYNAKQFWDEFGNIIMQRPNKIKIIVDIPENKNSLRINKYGEPK